MTHWLAMFCLAAAPSVRPVIFDAGYPKAYYFRWSESQANSARNSYEDFATMVGGLMGIQGKVLDEEVRIDPTRKIERFDRYKREHPDQLVLLHVNGNGRDPGFEGSRFAAGHWLYYEGCPVLGEVPARPGEMVFQVARPELFRCRIGRLGMASNEDLGLCALVDGRPDWSRAEQLQLVATDPAAGTITVRRGAFGTPPLAFAAGQAYVAAHVGEGPWGPAGNRQLLWSYNYATTCPKDAAGRDCSQVWIDHLAELLGPGGVLERFDGLEFDVLWDEPFELPVYNPLGDARRVDADADGRGDGGVVDGVNVYGYGVTGFLSRLRDRLGDQRLLLADGTHDDQQRGVGVLNGIESESFPENTDTALRGWSDGVNRHLYWAQHGRAPRFQYLAHKFVLPPADGRQLPPSVHAAPWPIHRAILAAACLTDSAVAVNSHPPAEPGEPVGIWDELRAGTDRRLGWLGQPLEPAQRLATRTPDLLHGAADPPTQALAAGLRAVNCRVALESDQLVLRDGPAAEPWRVRLPPLACAGPDLFVAVEASADPVPGAPPGRPRKLEVALVDDSRLLLPARPDSGLRLPAGRLSALDPASGATVQYVPSYVCGGEGRPAYHVHPPYQPGWRGTTLWWRDVTVPAGGRLRFATGLADLAAERSDGVTFTVLVAAGGRESKVFEVHQTAPPWAAHEVDLSAYADRRVRLVFEAGPGPAGHTTTDHGAWADVRLTGAGRAGSNTAPAVHWTWLGESPFAAGFGFGEVQPPDVELELRCEPGAPVRLRRVTVHAAADTMLRRFEGGLVLANPAASPQRVGLPPPPDGQVWRRLRGSPGQDPGVNNGRIELDKVVLPARDGLFLMVAER